jgi:PKD repeat protein
MLIGLVIPAADRRPGTRIRRIDMQRLHRHFVRRVFVVLAVLSLVGAFGTSLTHQGTVAQDATPTGTAGSPLVGTWQWGPAVGVSEPVWFGIFHADGTYMDWNQVAGAGIGLWRMTGERTFDLVTVATDANPSPMAWAPGAATFTLTGELDATGNAFTVTGTIDVRDAGGVLIATVPWSAPATRMTFKTNPATGSIPATPTAATPNP